MPKFNQRAALNCAVGFMPPSTPAAVANPIGIREEPNGGMMTDAEIEIQMDLIRLRKLLKTTHEMNEAGKPDGHQEIHRAWDEIRWMKEQIFAGEAAFLESKGKPPFVPRAKAAKAK